ncbi:hypothetical protein BH23PAT2_BH23PAT2_03770 [soil metagenome]
MKYSIIGSAIDGNKGAAAMLEAAIQTIAAKDEKAEFTLLSMYPEADKKINTYDNLQIISAKPLYLGLVINPLSLLYRILPPLRPLLRTNQQIAAIAEADVFLDQGGITFVDGREVFLIYNIASILPAMFIGTPVVKCSQAMGPFESRVNSFFAKLFLPHVAKIYARGQKTYESLQKLSLDNVELVADYAFSMNVTKLEAKISDKLLKKNGYDKSRRNIGVFPSEVLRKKAEKLGQNYEEVIANFIDAITVGDDATVYLVPHSQKPSGKRHNNDLPVCRDIYEFVKNKKQCVYINEPTSPQQLRHIIGQMDINVVARFHAMVSSLAMGVPVLVTGWSHKYQEVLDMFELQDSAFDASQLSVDGLMQRFTDVFQAKQKHEKLIKNNLSAVQASSIKQADEIYEIAKSV